MREVPRAVLAYQRERLTRVGAGRLVLRVELEGQAAMELRRPFNIWSASVTNLLTAVTGWPLSLHDARSAVLTSVGFTVVLLKYATSTTFDAVRNASKLKFVLRPKATGVPSKLA